MEAKAPLTLGQLVQNCQSRLQPLTWYLAKGNQPSDVHDEDTLAHALQQEKAEITQAVSELLAKRGLTRQEGKEVDGVRVHRADGSESYGDSSCVWLAFGTRPPQSASEQVERGEGGSSSSASGAAEQPERKKTRSSFDGGGPSTPALAAAASDRSPTKFSLVSAIDFISGKVEGGGGSLMTNTVVEVRYGVEQNDISRGRIQRTNLNGSYDIELDNGNVVANVAAQFISVVTTTARVQPSAATDRVRQRATRDNDIITAANAACMGLSRTAGRVQSDMSLFMSTFTSGMTLVQKRTLVREAERLKRVEPDVRADAADAADAEADSAVAGLRAFQTARVAKTGHHGVLSYVHKGRLETGERTEGSESDFALFQRTMNVALSLALVVSTPPRLAARVRTAADTFKRWDNETVGGMLPITEGRENALSMNVGSSANPCVLCGDGDPLPFMQSLPLMVCYYCYYNMPNIAQTVLISLDKWHSYVERKAYAGGSSSATSEAEIYAATPAGAKRPDLLKTYSYNNTKFNDTHIEFTNSINARAAAATTHNDFETHARTNNLMAPKHEFLRKMKDGSGIKRSDAPSELLRIWNTMPAKAHATASEAIQAKQAQMFWEAMNGDLDGRFAPIGKVALGFNRVPSVIETVKQRTVEWAAGGGFQSDKFKVANLKATASELDVDISAAKSKAEIAAAIHSALTSSLGEGASFKYVLREDWPPVKPHMRGRG